MPEASEHKADSQCHGQCNRCMMMPAEHQGGPSGAPLVWASAGAFIFPLVLAIVAGALLRENPVGQTLGVVAGLLAGAILASLTIRLFKRRFGEQK